MNLGYIRVSTSDQNLGRQLEEMKGLDEVYQDKASGKNADRPQLKSMLSNLRQGDTVTVLSLDRLGRNCKDLQDIASQIKGKGATLRCMSPQFTTEDMFGEFFLQVIGAISELERKQILERQRQGIALAKQLGKYQGRRPKQLEGFDKVYTQWLDGKISMEQAGKLLGISRATFYRRVKRYEDEELIDF